MDFSIIVPVYNAEKYLRQCLDSLCCQRGAEYELILVDDGSDDCCGVICDEYAKLYSFVRVIHQENQGPSGARNTGIAASKGKWLLFIDSDDWAEPDLLSVIAERMRKHPAELYCYNAWKADEAGNPLEKMIFYPENEVFSVNTEERLLNYYHKDLMTYRVGWELWMRVWNADIIRQNQIRFISTKKVFAEDYLFTFEYLMHVNRIECVCNILYHYRQREGSVMATLNQETVLPRLYNWAEEAYSHICSCRKKLVKKNFPMLYVQLMDFHIEYMLGKLPYEKLMPQLKVLDASKNHRKWCKKGLALWQKECPGKELLWL